MSLHVETILSLSLHGESILSLILHGEGVASRDFAWLEIHAMGFQKKGRPFGSIMWIIGFVSPSLGMWALGPFNHTF